MFIAHCDVLDRVLIGVKNNSKDFSWDTWKEGIALTEMGKVADGTGLE